MFTHMYKNCTHEDTQAKQTFVPLKAAQVKKLKHFSKLKIDMREQ